MHPFAFDCIDGAESRCASRRGLSALIATSTGRERAPADIVTATDGEIARLGTVLELNAIAWVQGNAEARRLGAREQG